MSGHWMSAVMLDSRPLLEVIESRANRHDSLNEFAREMCGRLGISAKDCSRALYRLRSKDRVSIYAADRYLTAMGLHLIEVYGWEEYSKHVDLSDVEDDVMTEEECC